MARIACIHAHPDDAEILLGGTLTILARKGHAVTVVTMTPGDCGTKEHSPEVISRMRRAEGAAGAAAMGARYACAEFRDMAVFNDDESRRRVTALLRDLRPDVVITASPSDYHCDHEATSHLVRDACFGAGCPNYDCSAFSEAAAMDTIPHLYFADPVEGTDREGRIIRPDFVVDIASSFVAKRDALACHVSQRQWLSEHHGMDNYLDEMERWTRARGKLAGLEFGEGFRHYKIHPYPHAPLLEDLLGAELVNRFV